MRRNSSIVLVFATLLLLLINIDASASPGTSKQSPIAVESNKQASHPKQPWLPFWKKKKDTKLEATKRNTTRVDSETASEPATKQKPNDRSSIKQSLQTSSPASFYHRFRRRHSKKNSTAVSAADESNAANAHRLACNSTATKGDAATFNATTTSSESNDSDWESSLENATMVPIHMSSVPRGLVLLAPAQGSAYRYGRSAGRAAAALQRSKQQQQQQGGVLSSSPPGNEKTALIMEGLLLPVLTVVTRYFILPWLSNWLLHGKEEDAVHPVQHFSLEQVNDRYQRDAQALSTALQVAPRGWSQWKWSRMQRRRQRNNKLARRMKQRKSVYSKTVIVVDLNTMDGGKGTDSFDLKSMADIVSFLLEQHRSGAFGTTRVANELIVNGGDDASDDTNGKKNKNKKRNDETIVRPADLEIILLITSPGGSVSSFGLAAAHVQRLAREPNVQLTACVDSCAASGGYMIASQAHKLVAAEFASIGSVGVIMEGLNFYDLVKRYGVKPLVIKAGDSKNPFTRFGEVNSRDVAHEKKSLEQVHEAFKAFILEGRPSLENNLDQVADGSVWLGRDAMELNLVDEVMTSSEYIQHRVEAFDRVLKLHRANPNRNLLRLLSPSHPLDLVPHLKSWAAKRVSGDGAKQTLSFLIQAVGLAGVIHHAFHKGRHQR
ncbi:hypothetical protein MPSEU_001035400 [Mayamaea pseudoterrestris]|nr:hypothetical protein MPSEU_001035400 [Mayamaea pseudoterrestris]